RPDDVSDVVPDAVVEKRVLKLLPSFRGRLIESFTPYAAKHRVEGDVIDLSHMADSDPFLTDRDGHEVGDQAAFAMSFRTAIRPLRPLVILLFADDGAE